MKMNCKLQFLLKSSNKEFINYLKELFNSIIIRYIYNFLIRRIRFKTYTHLSSKKIIFIEIFRALVILNNKLFFEMIFLVVLQKAYNHLDENVKWLGFVFH